MIYLAVDGALAGYAALSDSLREESADMIRCLKKAGCAAGASDGGS